MPTLQIEAPDPTAILEPPRKRWTRAECEMLEPVELLDHERLELVEGELISKMGKKRPHSNSARSIFSYGFNRYSPQGSS
jgi:hypothetical protein